MAFLYNEPSRTFSEYLLIPNLTSKDCIPENVSLKTPVVKFRNGERPSLELNIPIVSSIMQAVSDDNMAVTLARCGGLSFIFVSQPIQQQAEMIRKVKKYKAGFVISDSNVKLEDTLQQVIELKEKTGHSTIAVTDNGSQNGKLLGMITSRDYRISRINLNQKVKDFMTPFSKLIVGKEGISLTEANNLIWEHKLNCLPIIDKEHHLTHLVFRKDYDLHKENPNELSDENKSLLVGAGINTRDYKERVPILVDAGVDILCIDSSDGFTEWQSETIKWVKETYGSSVKVGAGNVVDKEGFLYLVESGADFVKVGIGPGSICITREQKGIGRGQATAIIEIGKERNEYYKKKGIYVPICSDGGIVHDYHITLALAMGADFVMMGRYFARFDESPTKKIMIGNNFVKEYWAEGSNKAKNWQRYDIGGNSKLEFEEGVDSYVPYAGSLKENLNLTLSKIKSTMCNCGAKSISELQEKARITLVSSTSIREGGTHDIILKENNFKDI